MIDDSADGWEDELGRTAFPEENEESAIDEEDTPDDVDYWTEDEEDEFEEEREAYYGFARVPRRLPAAAPGQESIQPGKAPESGVFFSCPLCLEAPKESSATQCGHLFCTS